MLATERTFPCSLPQSRWLVQDVAPNICHAFQIGSDLNDRPDWPANQPWESRLNEGPTGLAFASNMSPLVNPLCIQSSVG